MFFGDDDCRAAKQIQQDPDGEITVTADNLKSIVWFDAAGRRTLAQDPKGTKVASAYDGFSRLTRTTETLVAGSTACYTDYVYDGGGRLTRQTGVPLTSLGLSARILSITRLGL